MYVKLEDSIVCFRRLHFSPTRFTTITVAQSRRFHPSIRLSQPQLRFENLNEHFLFSSHARASDRLELSLARHGADENKEETRPIGRRDGRAERPGGGDGFVKATTVFSSGVARSRRDRSDESREDV